MDNTDNMSGENPGVLIKVDGRLVPCDKYIASMRTNIELALKWKDEESTLLACAYAVIINLMDETLTLEDVQQYVDDREQEPFSKKWSDRAMYKEAQMVVYHLMDSIFTVEALRDYMEEREERGIMQDSIDKEDK
jgi:hypothetical protein